MSYSSQAQIEAILGRSLTTAELVFYQGLQLGADNWIDTQTDKTWGTGSTSRYYDGGSTILPIDACRNITSVQLIYPDGANTATYTYTADLEYVLAPLNDTVKTYIEKLAYFPNYSLYGDDTNYGIWPQGPKRILVTGTFSYADSAPTDISYLSAYLTARAIYYGFQGQLQEEAIEGYQRRYFLMTKGEFSDIAKSDATVRMILDKYTADEIFF